MNLIEKLLKAKGLNKCQVARELGLGYHSVQKTIKGVSYTTKRGELKFRECRHIREKFASWLGYTYEFIWGPSADVFLKKLIREEIDRRIERRAKVDKEHMRQALGI